ncbi:serine/threonine-protein kinase [Paraliomyxa miuraensis]|uniref:serine/threonine-protein kinase n=1 Tax=Paraliomyxa miuraensis TaxID=376150 RepID=UPI002252F30B|nr:serine/threonine-protein kinase [Paraliomyxa miuraensis]MCX4242025.1 serine/threonine-protein kinase [Paraliomyxa miuraensis]
MQSTGSDDLDATLVADDGVRDEDARLPAPGDRVGRYEILRRLGAGAVGVVYEARDPQLDRRVAIKLLRTTGASSTSATAQHADLLQEARGLARLSHPNVVVINDVGRLHDDGPVWIAMELADGTTLDRWLEARGPSPRSWRELSPVLLAMGEALAAAHAVNIVHRDFKPANVIVSPEDRPRVLDFGLARSLAEEESTVDHDESPLRPAAMRIEGTPAYMAPEQWAGGPVGAAADQFAYCAVLYEALTGDRPFAGDTVASIARGVTEGQLRPSPHEASLPAFVRRALRRGLSTEPNHRWPSMRALLDALSARRRATRWLVVAAASLAVAAVLWLQPAPTETCEADPTRLAQTWDDARRAAVVEALATASPDSDDVPSPVAARLDGLAEQWQQTWVEACEAGRSEDEDEGDDGAALDLRMRCLEDVRRELQATVDALARADADTARRAAELVELLPAPRSCMEPGDATHAPPAAIAEAVDALEVRLAHAIVQYRLGRLPQAEQELAALLPQAQALGWSRLEARVGIAHANVLNLLARFDDAVAALERASAVALQSGDDALAAEAAVQMVSTFGFHLQRFDDAERWARHAEAALQRLGDAPKLRGQLLNHLALMAERHGDREHAVELHREALRIRLTLPDDRTGVAMSHENLGNALRAAEQLGEAREHLERALEIRRERLGVNHPDVGATLSNLGNVALDEGDFAQAKSHYEHALAILSTTLDEDHPRIGVLLNNLSIVAYQNEQVDLAITYLQRALVIMVRRRGDEHTDVLLARLNLASMQAKQGHTAEAIALAEQVRRQASPEHPEIVAFAEGLIEQLRGPPERSTSVEEHAP